MIRICRQAEVLGGAAFGGTEGPSSVDIFVFVCPPVDKSILAFLLEVTARHFPEPLTVRCDQVLASGVCPGPANSPESLVRGPCLCLLARCQESSRRPWGRGVAKPETGEKELLLTLVACPRAPHPPPVPLHRAVTENHPVLSRTIEILGSLLQQGRAGVFWGVHALPLLPHGDLVLGRHHHFLSIL